MQKRMSLPLFHPGKPKLWKVAKVHALFVICSDSGDLRHEIASAVQAVCAGLHDAAPFLFGRFANRHNWKGEDMELLAAVKDQQFATVSKGAMKNLRAAPPGVRLFSTHSIVVPCCRASLSQGQLAQLCVLRAAYFRHPRCSRFATVHRAPETGTARD